MKYIILIIRSFIIIEKKTIKKNIALIEYYLKNINFIEYAFFLFDRNRYNPIKSKQFKNFINVNKPIWIKKGINKPKSDHSILVESFINHSAYNLSNAASLVYLNALYKMKMVGLIRSNDLKSEVLFRSFGVKSFIFFKHPNIISRVYYICKAVIFVSKKKNFNNIYKAKYQNIDVGLTAYDSYIRYMRVPTLKKINSDYIVFLAEALYACDFISKKLLNFNIKKSIQAETQFTPLNILFQLCLKNKIEVFSRSGLENFTIRRFNSWSQRYSNRASISQKIFNEVFMHQKKKCISIVKKKYQNMIKKKVFGVDEVILGLSKKTTNHIDKKKILKNFKSKNKKIVVFFLSHLLDGNFNYGYRNNFQDIYTSTKFIIDRLEKFTNINWIIKKHPNHDFYNSKVDFQNRLEFLEKKHNHIMLMPENIDSSSLLKIADVALTISGTVGIEYPSFGIRSLFFEKSYYSNLNFLNFINSKKKLLETLKNLHKDKKIKNNLIEKCQVYLFIKDVLIKNQSTLVPKYIPSRKINENEFWLNASKKVKKFEFSKDEFYQMFKKQIKYNMRHTLNFNSIKLTEKKYNDFED